jgi:hypothetical protein
MASQMNAKCKGKGKGKGKGENQKRKGASALHALSTNYSTLFAYSIVVLVIVGKFFPVTAQTACPISLLETLTDLTEPCCQATPDGVCGDAFPLVCPQSCAKGLVDLWDICDTLARQLPNDFFPAFLIDKCLPPSLLLLATRIFECTG